MRSKDAKANKRKLGNLQIAPTNYLIICEGFEKITSDGKLEFAISNCKYMEKINNSENESKRNPMTTVYRLMEGLKDYL